MSIDLTPNPRILQVIAEVDLGIEQCLAELIDNCFDELRKAREEEATEEHRIDVTLPTPKQVTPNAVITVADSGRGMDLEQMRSAMRAGASSNNPVDSLGLFGMGFNVATARLGRRTEVKSGKAGSTEWNIVEIDLDAMTSSDSFTAPVRTEPKSNHEHGTIISVSRLNSDILDRLRSTRAASTTTAKLGRIYTYMLRDPLALGISGAEIMGGLGLNLYLNGSIVDPVIPCIWSPERSVPYGGADIPAVMPIDFPLADGYVCMNCGHWHGIAVGSCSECRSQRIQARERHVRGWIGIQRYIDAKDYGLTFFRNGRAILSQDKSYFGFTFDDDMTEIEYPEMREGRIVGELHLDHISVNVRKTDFDQSSSAWADARRLVRGESPLRPKIADRRGYLKNYSPLANLFGAYRRNDPGTRYLIPGDGKSALHNQARAWAEKFRMGDPHYATDDRWYEAVLIHERGPELDDESETADDAAIVEEMGLGDLTLPSPAPADEGTKTGSLPQQNPASLVGESASERVTRYIDSSTRLNALSGLAKINNREVELRTYLHCGPGLNPEDGGRGWAINANGGVISAFIASAHFLIQDYGWLPTDALLTCISQPLANLYYHGDADGRQQAMRDVLSAFPDLRLTPQTCRTRGEDLLHRLRQSFGQVTSDHTELWAALAPDSKMAAEAAARPLNPSLDWDKAIDSGTFGLHLTPLGMADLIQARPELLLDGKALSASYASWSSEPQTAIVRRLTGLFTDLAALVDVGLGADRRDMRRLSLSADILDDLVVD